MELILFVGDDCPPCEEVERAFREKYKEELATGEAQVINLEHDEEAQEFWLTNELPLAPTVVAMSDNARLMAILDTEELVSEAAQPEAV